MFGKLVVMARCGLAGIGCVRCGRFKGVPVDSIYEDNVREFLSWAWFSRPYYTLNEKERVKFEGFTYSSPLIAPAFCSPFSPLILPALFVEIRLRLQKQSGLIPPKGFNPNVDSMKLRFALLGA
jgi:hypothetical protein